MNIQDIKVGQIWKVKTNDFLTTSVKAKNQRATYLFQNENIEIRFAHEWNFRTQDNLYFHALPQTIIDNCVLVGEIWENVRLANKTKLNQILELELFDRSDDVIV
jgi:hypothetical protein